MSKTLAELAVVISARATEFEKSLNVVNRNLDKTLKKTERVGKQMSVGLTAPLVGLGTVAVMAYDKQAKAIAQVEQGLKSTGNIVGFTSQELQKMASNLQKKTIFGDETILKDATAQLLTFTNISGTQFERTQQAALDLATRLDGDLKSASIQLGKALNDPVANLSALSRSGIQFTDSQKKVIKSLSESGRLAEAQTIILDELNKQYGGSAEAATAGAGGLQQLANAAGDVAEQFGPIILDMLNPLIEGLQDAAEEFGDLDDETKKVVVSVAGVAAAIGPVLVVSSQLIRSTNTVTGAFVNMGSKIVSSSAAMTAIPWVAAAAGIAALAYALSDYVDLTDDAEEAQNVLNDATKTASVDTAVQRRKVDELVSSIKDANSSEEDRTKALKELQKLSPDIFKNMTTEKEGFEKLEIAAQKYNQQLLNIAKARVLEKMIDSQVEKLAELEAEAKEAPSNFDTAIGTFGRFNAMLLGFEDKGGSAEVQMKRIGDETNETQTKLDALLNELTEVNQTLPQTEEEAEKVATQFKGIADAAEATQQTLEDLKIEDVFTNTETGNSTGGGGFQFEDVSEEEEFEDPEVDADIEAYQESLADIQSRMQEVGAVADQMGSSIGGAFGEFVAGSKTGEQAMKQVAKSIVAQVIKIAKANVIANATSPSNATNLLSGGLATPALIVAGLSALEAFIPALAEGGMTMGPTLALIGDNKSGKEAVIPFEKMGSFLNQFGGGGRDGNVAFEISGESLVGVMREYESNSNSFT